MRFVQCLSMTPYRMLILKAVMEAGSLNADVALFTFCAIFGGTVLVLAVIFACLFLNLPDAEDTDLWPGNFKF
jgi:hypothetical protein